MCSSKLKSFRSQATHQTCLRPGWLQNAEQVSALVNIYSSMGTTHIGMCVFVCDCPLAHVRATETVSSTLSDWRTKKKYTRLLNMTRMTLAVLYAHQQIVRIHLLHFLVRWHIEKNKRTIMQIAVQLPYKISSFCICLYDAPTRLQNLSVCV